MQTAKSSKKSGFKCPTFSVPSKSSDEKIPNGKTDGEAPELEKQDKVPVKTSEVPNPAGDNTEDLQVVPEKNTADQGDDNKETKQCTEDEDKKEHGDRDESQNGDENKETEKMKKVIKKKKSSDFKVAAKPQGVAGTSVVKNTSNIQSAAGKQTDKKEKKKLEKKEKSTAERKPAKEKVAKPKTEPMPVKSLTEDEYEELFNAVLLWAENLDIDNWEPKVSPPVKVREPVKKKYSITVGKKPKPLLISTTNSQEQVQKDTADEKDESLPDKDDLEGNVAEDKDLVVEIVYEQDGSDHEENDEDVEKPEEIEDQSSIADEPQEEGANEPQEEEADEPQEEGANNDDQEPVLEVARVASVQLENETTPAVSEVDFDTKPQPEPKLLQPKKKLKPKKRAQLEPKMLPFQKKEATGTSMLDQVKKIKKEKAGKRKLSDVHDKSEPKVKSKPEVKKAECNTYAEPVPAIKDGGKSRKKVSKKKQMQDRELNLEDKVYNSCEMPEESYDESEHIYTKFTEGSVVWAKMTGYPWWPAMVEIDPDSETFFLTESEQSMIPTHYHVVFFDERVSRCWVKALLVCQFTGKEDKDGVVNTVSKKGQSYTKEIAAAKKNASRALICTLKERIELFGFAARYKGVWESKQVKGKAGSKSKSDKREKQRKSSGCIDTELLDDNTMDEVLDNAEDLLDNVEDLLESLDSDFLDSEEDSEFCPGELVVVEKKRKQTGKQRDSKVKKQKNSNIESSPGRNSENLSDLEDERNIETEIEQPDNEYSDTGSTQLSELDQLKIVSNECEGKTMNHTKIQLDPEIFTMEMDEESKDEIIMTVHKKDKKSKAKKTSKKMTETSKKDADIAGKFDNAVTQKKNDKTDKQPGEKEMERKKTDDKSTNKKTMTGKLESKKSEMDENGSMEESDEAITVNEGNEEETTEKCDANTDTNKEKKVEIASNVAENEPDDKDDNGKNKYTRDLIQSSDNDSDDEEMNLFDNKNEAVMEKVMLTDNDNIKECLQDQALDTNDNKNQSSENKSGINLNEDSEDEFNLDETMYDDNVVRGDDKIRERVVDPVPVVTHSDEESDPFDLMEE